MPPITGGSHIDIFFEICYSLIERGDALTSDKTMRKLTIKQKKMLDQAIHESGGITKVYSEIDLGDIGHIDAVNPCEIFYQNVNQYIWEKKFKN